MSLTVILAAAVGCLALSESAFAAEAPEGSDCSQVVSRIRAACKAPDIGVAAQVAADCRAFSAQLRKLDGDLATANRGCNTQTRRRSNRGAGRARANQRDNPTDQANLLQANQQDLGKCSGDMVRIAGLYRQLAETATTQAAALGERTPAPQAACRSAAESAYAAFKSRAEERASAAEKRGTDYDGVARALGGQENQGRDNAQGMSGDGKKADDKPGAGGGSGGPPPDPSSLMQQAMKAKQEADAKAEQERQKAEAERKAAEAKAKQERIRACEIGRAARRDALADCDRRFNLGGTVVVPTNANANEDCKTKARDANPVHEDTKCELTP